jgi:aconitate hydratase
MPRGRPRRHASGHVRYPFPNDRRRAPYEIFRLESLEKRRVGRVSRLPCSIRILLENLLRHEDGSAVTGEDIQALAGWSPAGPSEREIAFRPARVLMQDFTGVPALVDLASMRDAARRMGKDPKEVNPQMPVDLVIDHSVQVDRFSTVSSFQGNVEREYERNGERYAFLRWERNPSGTSASCRPARGSATR